MSTHVSTTHAPTGLEQPPAMTYHLLPWILLPVATALATLASCTRMISAAAEVRVVALAKPAFTLLTITLLTTAADVDACIHYPCTNGTGAATCHDLPPPALDTAAGRNCTCNTGFLYQNDISGCRGACSVDLAKPVFTLLTTTPLTTAADVDACIHYPCTNGTGAATCHDLPPPALDTAAGRSCSCNYGFNYLNDTVGCISVGECSTTHNGVLGQLSVPGTSP
jgi:hypothetical protein